MKYNDSSAKTIANIDRNVTVDAEDLTESMALFS